MWWCAGSSKGYPAGVDTDPQPDPDPAASTDPASASDAGPVTDPADDAPGVDEPPGASPTDEPTASDAYGHDETLVGDFTASDVDLSHLVPADDGDPDDEEEAPAPGQAGSNTSPQVSEEETIAQDPTGQALIEEGRSLASERDDLIAGGADPASLGVPLHPDDVQEPTA